ncbi:MAG: efflux RND transporter permease subunit [Planctomycetota bacterium]|nr:efflux RND transporter permease subunit [Planctomycetota bacterium]
MSLSAPFIHRPVGTTLLTIAIALAGMLAYQYLPVSPLPQVDFPSIFVNASLPGASPETMASAVATPLEHQFTRIAGVTEMTSNSSLGSTSVTLVFDLSRNIDAAARDVQAAINAARGDLPANLPSNPSYRKINPADAPILILSLTSDTYTRGQMYDAASSILAQKLSQVQGVGQVNVGGGALPAVRVEVNPTVLNAMGMSLEDIRACLAAANANLPKGALGDKRRTWELSTTDQLLKAREYLSLIVGYRDGLPVRMSDVAQVTDSVEDIHTGGVANGKSAVLLIISRQPQANIIDTTDRVLALLPEMQAQIPANMHLQVVMDRTSTIRSSVHDTEVTLCVSIVLVVMVVFLFLRDWRSTLIPSVAVPISLLGTFGVMYLLNYSIDNLSLMALTISTGFVVDDAIVVIENITRHLEKGLSPLEAALVGAKEIGFTVMSISISLVAVFIPIMLMGGYIGRLFGEFAITLAVAIGVSMIVSLTTTPMMCALLLRPKSEQKHGGLYAATEGFFQWILHEYEITLAAVLRHPLIMILVTLGTIAFTAYLYVIVPKGLFPQQDTGRLQGTIQADQDTSFQAISKLLARYETIVSKDPTVENVVGFSGGGRGGGGGNTAHMFVTLKPLAERKISADQVIANLRKAVIRVPGATLTFQAVQDLVFGGRQSAAQYQYTLRSDSLADLLKWAPRLAAKMPSLTGIVDVNTDQQNHGLQASLVIDRAIASRLGVTPAAIDNVLYDAFGQRQVSTMYSTLNQYHVVMTVEQRFWQNPDGLRYIYVAGTGGQLVPLDAFSHYEPTTTSLSVAHQGESPAITLSFNLTPGFALPTVQNGIEQAMFDMGMPASIHGNFAGTAKVYQDTQANQMMLIIGAIIAVYIVLGILYESLIHPITILSTIPSAGVGALLSLLIFKTDLTVIAMIGIILLIGIVKKNAIMMIDFALEAERRENKAPHEAIFQACVLRFRPITMTTMAALLGALPLALGGGVGSEMRKPLGIAIIGGLIFSQMLTLYTTPVVYLYLDRFTLWLKGKPAGPRPALQPSFQ